MGKSRLPTPPDDSNRGPRGTDKQKPVVAPKPAKPLQPPVYGNLVEGERYSNTLDDGCIGTDVSDDEYVDMKVTVNSFLFADRFSQFAIFLKLRNIKRQENTCHIHFTHQIS